MAVTALSGPRLDAQSGKAKSLVIFLHGYGADGKDLLGIGQHIAHLMPDTAFLAPNAPQPCAANPMGFQWFPIPWMDGSPESAMQEGIEASIDILNTYLDEVTQTEDVPAENIILFGFSQGTMMSLHVGLRREQQLGGIAGFSGRLLAPERLAEEIKSRPPVLLVHGEVDNVVPPSSLQEAIDALHTVGLEADAHMSRGTAHGIAQDGLELAVAFIRKNLGYS